MRKNETAVKAITVNVNEADFLDLFNSGKITYPKRVLSLQPTWLGLFEMAQTSNTKAWNKYINSTKYEERMDKLERMHDDFDEAITEMLDRNIDIVKILTKFVKNNNGAVSIGKDETFVLQGSIRHRTSDFNTCYMVLHIPYYRKMNISDETYARLIKLII